MLELWSGSLKLFWRVAIDFPNFSNYCHTVKVHFHLPITVPIRFRAISLPGRTHAFNCPFQELHRWGKTNLDFTEGRDSEWQWHQLGHMQVWHYSHYINISVHVYFASAAGSMVFNLSACLCVCMYRYTCLEEAFSDRFADDSRFKCTIICVIFSAVLRSLVRCWCT